MAMKECDFVIHAMRDYSECTHTDKGARILTHCLYPSHERVHVYVVKKGDGFRVHDGGDALYVCWKHARESIAHDSAFKKQAARYSIQFEEGIFHVDVQSVDWLQSAILAIANAAAQSTTRIVEKSVRAAEVSLKKRVSEFLQSSKYRSRVASDYDYELDSGRVHKFDFAILKDGTREALIDIVSPSHISVNAKFRAFSDIPKWDNAGRIAVYDAELEPEDKTLLARVAQVLPYASFKPGLERIVGRA